MTNGMKKSVGQSVSRYLCQVFSVYIYDTDLCDKHLNDQWNDKVSRSVSRYLCQVFSVYIYDTDLCDQHLNDQWNDEVSRSISQSVPVPSILSIHI